KNYSDDEVNALFCKIGKLPRIKNGQGRYLNADAVFNQVFIFDLLNAELIRLKERTILYCLKYICKLFRNKIIKFKGKRVTFITCYFDMIA
ncbi:hypothetical protein NCU85_22915, partial [Enterobacter roggenkampii]|nr:hypothetical protein [Enterobacter roggenkampii]